MTSMGASFFRFEHGPEKWIPVFGRRSCSINKPKRDDKSKRSHRALAAALALAAFAHASVRAEGLVTTKRLSASLAAELAMVAVTACAQKNYHVGVVVLDTSGVQQVALRGDGAAPQNVLNAND